MLSSENRRDSYTGDGTTVGFNYTFKVFTKNDLYVTVDDAVQTVDVHYTVSGVGEKNGGTVTFVIAPASSTSVQIRRGQPLQQSQDFKNQATFYQEGHENAMDKIVMEIQTLQDQIDRCYKLPEREPGTAALTTMPINSDRQLKGLTWDASGNPIAGAALPSSTVVISTFGETLIDDTDAATARATLGLDGSSGVITAGDLAESVFPLICQGRLTLTTALPVTTADVTGATTVYFTPYKGDKISLYDGTKWKMYTFAELSIAVPATTGTMYDVFVYDSGGSATLEVLAWTNDTTRATALAWQDGVLCKSGALTRRYVGSFRTTTSSGQTEDSLAKRYLWNYYNRVARKMSVHETTNTWNYTTATIRQANGSTSNQLDFIVGWSEDFVEAAVMVKAESLTTGQEFTVGIGLDSTTAYAAAADHRQVSGYSDGSAAGAGSITQAWYRGFPGVGRHYLAWLEWSVAGGTTTWLGDDGAGTPGNQSGIFGTIWG